MATVLVALKLKTDTKSENYIYRITVNINLQRVSETILSWVWIT